MKTNMTAVFQAAKLGCLHMKFVLLRETTVTGLKFT